MAQSKFKVIILLITALGFNKSFSLNNESYCSDNTKAVDLYCPECNYYSIKVLFRDSRNAFININNANCEINESSITQQKPEHSGFLDKDDREIELTYCRKNSVINHVKIRIRNKIQINCKASDILKCDRKFD